jgi:hypothetical protein
MVKSATACGRFENLPNITAKQTTDNKKVATQLTYCP